MFKMFVSDFFIGKNDLSSTGKEVAATPYPAIAVFDALSVATILDIHVGVEQAVLFPMGEDCTFHTHNAFVVFRTHTFSPL